MIKRFWSWIMCWVLFYLQRVPVVFHYFGNSVVITAVEKIKFEKEHSKCYINEELPEEILIDIFVLSTDYERPVYKLAAIRKLSGVCKIWSELIKDKAIGFPLDLTKSLDVNTEKMTKILNCCGSYVTEMYLGWAPQINDECLKMIGKECPKLRLFELSTGRSVTTKGVEELMLGKCRDSLQHVTYPCCSSYSFEKMVIDSCKNLQFLRCGGKILKRAQIEAIRKDSNLGKGEES